MVMCTTGNILTLTQKIILHQEQQNLKENECTV